MRLVAVLILAAAMLTSNLSFAQATSMQAQSSSTQAPPAAQPSGSTPSSKAPTTPDRANAQTSVPADIKEVRRNLEALKTAVTKMDEGPEHDMAEQNVKFLESLVSYLEHENATKSGMTPRSRRPTSSDSTKGLAGENPKK